MIQVTEISKHGHRTVLDLADGNTVELLSPPTEDAYSVMMGTIHPGGGAPLHSHPEAESFYVLSGNVEALVQTTCGLEWRRLSTGDFIHIPAGVKHAWRNRSIEPMSALITCTAKLGRAFQEMGQLASAIGPKFPSPAAIRRIAEISERYGHWLGSPEENSAVGIHLT
jgi:quercetin dioxygenase-like cupin family protein